MISRFKINLPPALIGALGLLALFDTYLLNRLGRVSGQYNVGIIGTTLGLMAGIWLDGAALYMYRKKRSLLEFNPYIILATYASIVVVVVQGAAYVALLIIVSSLKTLSL